MALRSLIPVVICFLSLSFFALPQLDAGQDPGYVYWTVNENGEVWRSRVDTPIAEQIMSPFVLGAHAADFTGGKLYFNFDDHLLRTDLDGSNHEVIVSGTGEVLRIRIDPAGKLYWMERDHQRIRRADLDGGNVETILPGVVSGFPNALGIDPAGGKLYFEDGSDLKRANLDGTGVETLVEIGPNTNGIAIDSANGKVYLADSSAPLGIRWCDLDGSNLAVIRPSTSLDDLQVLDGHVYFLEQAAGGSRRSLFAMDLGGGNEEQISSNYEFSLGFSLDLGMQRIYGGVGTLQGIDYDGSSPVPITATISDSLHDVVVDPEAERFFWSDFSQRAIHVSSLEDALPRPALVDRDALQEVRGLALDSVGGRLFWASTQSAGGIWRDDLDGQGATEIVSALTKPHDVAYEPGGDRVYWTENIAGGAGSFSGVVGSAQADGSNVVDVHTGLPQSIRGVTVDPVGGKLYWTDQAGGEISRSDLNGSNAEVILTGLDAPHDVAVDSVDGKLYWTEGIDNGDDPNGKIRRADLNGSNPEDVLIGLTDLIRDLTFVRHQAIPLFASGFENGKTNNWSDTLP